MKQEQNGSLEASLQKIILWAALLTPLVVATSQAIFPFIFPKAIYFEVTASLFAILLIPAVWQGLWRPFAQKGFFWILIAYICALLASSYTAFDVNRALWSDFERMTGAVFIIFSITFGIFVAYYFYQKNEQSVQALLRVMLWISAVISMSGLIQVFDPSFLNSTGTRVAGVFGNPIYLGGFAAESLLFVGYLLFLHLRDNMRIELSIIGLIHLAALYYSGTRGSLLALCVGCAVLLFAFIPQLWARGHQRPILISACSVAAVMIFLIVGTQFRIFGQTSMINRLLDISSVTGTAETRFIAWDIAWKGFQERPLLGWGPENYFYVFNKFFNPHSQLFGDYETWFDHAHNAPLEVLVSQGAVGFVLYLLQYVVLLWMAVRLFIKNNGSAARQVFYAVLGTFFIVHFVHNLFVFDHPASYMFFYFVAGLLFAEYVSATAEPFEKKSASQARIRFTQIFVFCLMLWAVVPSVRQNYGDLSAQILMNQGDLPGAQAQFEQVLAIQGPHTADVLLDIGRSMQAIPPEQIMTKKTYYDFGLNSLQTLLTTYEPANVLAAILDGQLLTNVAVVTNDQKAIDMANSVFAVAAHFSPDRQQVYYSWARLKFITKQNDDGIKLMERAVALEPKVAISHWYFATMLMDVDKVRAAAELQSALDLGYSLAGPEQIHAAAQMFAQVGNYAAAVAQDRQIVEQGYISSSTDPFLLELDGYATKAHDTSTQQWLHNSFPGNTLPAVK